MELRRGMLKRKRKKRQKNFYFDAPSFILPFLISNDYIFISMPSICCHTLNWRCWKKMFVIKCHWPQPNAQKTQLKNNKKNDKQQSKRASLYGPCPLLNHFDDFLIKLVRFSLFFIFFILFVHRPLENQTNKRIFFSLQRMNKRTK